MPLFTYRGVNKSGKSVKGKINSPSEEDARKKLRLLGIKVRNIKLGDHTDFQFITIDKKGNITIKFVEPKVADKDLVVFTKQLSVMINAGLTIANSLDILQDQSSNPRLKKVLGSIRDNLEGGLELADSMEKHPDVFDSLYTNLVRAGAQSGQLDVMMERLSQYIEKSAKLKRSLISALTYPAIVICIAFVMIIVMLLFVVPIFAQQFQEAGKELPGLTQLIIDVSEWLQANYYLLFIGLVGVYFWFQHWKKTPEGNLHFDNFLLRAPVIGDLISKISIARFTSTLGTLTKAGVSLMDSLDTCSKAVGNKILEKEIKKIKNAVIGGKTIASHLEKSKYFPKLVSSMVKTGENTGELDTMLDKVSEFYEDEVEAAMATMLKLIEPIMFIVIGGIVGFILLAMYMPIFDLASTIGDG